MKEVLENFEKISQIPHCSFETEKLRDFLIEFAKDKNCIVKSDKAGNIHCIKGEPKICLQSHYDMVCMGEAPNIKLYEENGFLKAKNSSLGADNGIGVAIIMQVMSEFDNFECLLTNNEEVGLLGAKNLELKLHSKMLLNLDHEDEKDIIVSCAGGLDIDTSLKVHFKKSCGYVYELNARNFKGGHSGIDIVENRKNSIKEMAKFIALNSGEIIKFNGGERINSIAKNARVLVLFKEKIKENEFIELKFKGKKCVRVVKESKFLLNIINSFSQGVRSYNKNLNIVESSINLSLLKMKKKVVKFSLFARSNNLEALKNLEFETKAHFNDFKIKTYNFYAPWQGGENELSKMLLDELKKEIKEARISAIHAGLECGIIEQKQDLICACIGPNIYNPHSTDERCELASIERIKRAVFSLLKRIYS
ncbi:MULTISPECIES: M20/M25/M40 family metallo-hydrolase [unclassified Campylobacter]|uniref:M20/M25/M40 family metallo-hydrolase n=1 Tax=unclassified Campylobacter TaxID=2593542 RepID=UPI00123813AE|nr:MULTISPECIES: M20/M25/M40 family metallo-hydrolase [unclassified Campylobacter]KAA6224701.1 aminoacyl-histidine dipeptidase [Campylobacter sp. LR185c]KAA6225699.1 aminoacyl-histidine dipeptidase [Campylobacter sp. LR286c]KAA6225819.1 aminoacyl-histidine dipeptidase [Campylobacter sp. LR196d]KAA6229672.1 aminoacyl-histidine dipeptidase [Campylobacter sp. LR291e]KAA6230082.1 aminoacyl-histidine dipeptidase [Campylobacter sp. LR264d]